MTIDDILIYTRKILRIPRDCRVRGLNSSGLVIHLLNSFEIRIFSELVRRLKVRTCDSTPTQLDSRFFFVHSLSHFRSLSLLTHSHFHSLTLFTMGSESEEKMSASENSIIFVFITSIYFPSILVHILSMIPFWIENQLYADEIPGEKMPDEKKSNQSARRKIYESKRLFVSVVCLVLMTLLFTLTNLSGIMHCHLEYVWITYMMLMGIIMLIQIFHIERGDGNIGGKKWKIIYPLIFIMFNVVYWPVSFICVMKNINMC